MNTDRNLNIEVSSLGPMPDFSMWGNTDDLLTDKEVSDGIRNVPMHFATTPTFASVGHNGVLQLANSDSTNLSGPIITGVSAGTRVKEVRVYSGPTTAPGVGILTLQLDNGVTNNVIEVVTLTNTANLQQGIFRYDNLVLPNTSWNLRAQMRTAIINVATVHITALGEDLT